MGTWCTWFAGSSSRLRGLASVKADWGLLCTVHNLLEPAHATAARPICATA